MIMLEKMSDFFESRLAGYDEHMMNNIEFASEFYPLTASLLPMRQGASVLDLGCGTGLELTELFKLNPAASVVGIDLSQKMLDELLRKLSAFNVKVICGSYFDIPLGEKVFDSAVSVESLHHFTQEEKIQLYKKIRCAVKDDGYFILTDYFAKNEEEEASFRRELRDLMAKEGKEDGELYHFDTPLTVKHETEALIAAGFASVELIRSYGATCVIKASVH